jgi:serine protease AprX
VKRRVLPAIQDVAAEIRGIHRAARPSASLSPEEEARFLENIQSVTDLLSPIQAASVRVLGELAERQSDAMREEINRRTKQAVAGDQDSIEARILSLGGSIIGRIYSQNAVRARLPAEQLSLMARDPLVARIIIVPPAQPELDNHAISLGLTTGFWANGFDGGEWDAGILDTGVQQDHPNLNPAQWLSTFGTTDSDGHGTAVAGIIASNDATYRGMAFGLDTLLVGSFDFPMLHSDWMVTSASEDPEAINLSAGFGRADDEDYSDFDQFWDGLIDGNSLLVGKSAGNGGSGTTTITHPAPSYNLMAVGNMDDSNTVTRTDDVIASASSRGPTLLGRKKPDIVAPGRSTITTNNGWTGSNPDFINFTGTSAAAPHVTGAVILLTELRGSDNPAAIKSVLINTADAWTDNGTPGSLLDDGPVAGSEWNSTYGWGYLDLWEAWLNGLDVLVDTVDEGTDFKLYEGILFEGEKATLAWNRHVGYSGSNYPTAVEDLTDLDLRVYDQQTGAVLASSASPIDNVEQVAVAADGDVVLKVEVFGSIDPDVGIESFALATEENFQAAVLPSFSFDPGPFQVSPNQPFDFQVTVSNDGAIPAFSNSVELALPVGFSVLTGANPQNIGTIADGGFAQASWILHADCSMDPRNIGITNSSFSYGESFDDSTSVVLTAGTTSLSDDLPISGSFAPLTYDFPVVSSDWSAVGIDPGVNDNDVWADNDICITSPYRQSTSSGVTRDFIVANGRNYGDTTHYALVTPGPSAPYTIELDQAFDLSSSSVAQDFTPSEVVEAIELSVTAGNTYRVRVDVTAGTSDIALFGFSPDRADGDRSSASESGNSGGDGASEVVDFLASASGVWGFVVVNENAQSSNFVFSVAAEAPGPCGYPTDRFLDRQTINTTQAFVACNTISTGDDFVVDASGDVTFRAGTSIALGNGFSVASMAKFEAIIDPSLK